MSLLRRAGIVAGVAALVVALWAIATHSGGGPGWLEIRSQHMATTISVTVPDDDRTGLAGEIVSEVFADVDRVMSEWKPDSPLTSVNQNAGVRPVEVPAELRAVIRRGIEIGDATGGAFDITWAALWGLWDFKSEAHVVPDAGEIARRAALVDYRRVVIDDDAGTVYLPEAGMLIGLGGIAKGYAADVAVARLRDAGFEDFLLITGGQVYASGEKDGEAWRVGVRDPRGAPSDLIATIELRDASASTSGDYERFFEVDGRRYHHILDPRTGWPSEGARSVTVVTGSATLGDALSTALMVLGPEEGGSAADALGAWALVVDAEGRIVEIGGPAPRVTMHEGPASGVAAGR